MRLFYSRRGFALRYASKDWSRSGGSPFGQSLDGRFRLLRKPGFRIPNRESFQDILCLRFADTFKHLNGPHGPYQFRRHHWCTDFIKQAFGPALRLGGWSVFECVFQRRSR
jgi:hypothetical protein